MAAALAISAAAFIVTAPAAADAAGERHSIERLKAYRDSMEEHGLTVNEDNIYYGDFWYTNGERCVNLNGRNQFVVNGKEIVRESEEGYV